ncbi:MAG: IS982 family transposase [Bacteroidetes bacterium]|nr:MAG: IS982 family transposase [Bacteroidota bacterium]
MRTLIVYKEIQAKVELVYQQVNLKRFEQASGRPRKLEDTQVITLAIYQHTQGIPTKKQVYKDFELPCTYKTFCESVNRLLPIIVYILVSIMHLNRNDADLVKFTDSTDIPVCLNKNAKYHKTMAGLAQWGRSSKGFYFGLKLHITVDAKEKLLSICITPANTDDRKVFMQLNEKLMGLFVADAGYISQKLSDEFYIENERLLIAKPKANMKKLASWWQTLLYTARVKVETLFNNTKKFRGLISSLPRSLNGYLCNYFLALLAEVLA